MYKNTTSTQTQEIFKDKQILNERPPEMGFQEYHLLRKIQTQILKNIFRKAPNKRLSGYISPHKPIIQIARGFRKVSTQRKAS
jgi:hypothetical protein